MKGADFGGCTVAIIKSDSVDEYIETVGKAYEDKFGHEASFYVTDTGDGGKNYCVDSTFNKFSFGGF